MTSGPRRIGIFGGSFNPPHMGHVLACHYALSRWGLSQILVLPSFSHPFGKPLVSFEHRIALCRLAFKHLDRWVEVSPLEEELGGVSYTIDTVRAVARKFPDDKLALILGSDITADLPKWKDAGELQKLVELLVIPRIDNGVPLGSAKATDCLLPDISSTRVRAALKQGEALDSLFPADVRNYIQGRGLYQE